MADIGEKIFEAFDIIIQERLSGLHFDKTITGVIESIEGIAEEGKENKYIVNDGSTKYTVYSNNVYKVDTSVYVSIPNGDYTQKKFIVGYNLGQEDVKSSTLETDTFVDLTGAVWESVNETTLLANNPAILSKDIIWTTAPGIGTGDSIDYNKAPMGYSRMRLSAEISTLFGTKPVQGRYGIRGAVYGLDPKGTPVTSPVEFSTEEGWFGDYYNFDGWWPQEIIFELKDKINTVLDIKLSFYQIYDNENKEEKFLSASGKQLAYSADGALFDDNLKVRNIQISFGYSENELSGKNSLMVYAKQDEISRGQVYFSDTDGFRSPIAKARLVHFNEELQAFKEYNTWEEAKTLFEAKDVIPLDITYPRIEWYINRASAISKDAKDILTNPNLEKINKTIVEGEETKDIYAFEIALSEAIEQTKATHDFKAALQYLDMEKLKESFPKEGFSEEDLQNYFDGKLTDENKKAIAKALITQNSITVQSDFIKYTDEAVKDAAAIVDKATAVYLAHVGDKDQYKGRYNIYHNGVLKNDADGGIPRVVIPMFKNNKYKLTEGSKIIWKIPAGDDTMIDSSDYTQTPVDGYKIIEKTVENKKDKDGNKLNKIDSESYQLVYRISKLYSSIKDTRNIIKCQVKLNEETIFDEVSQEIFFGTTGAIGTNYGIEIKLEREYTLNNDIFEAWPDNRILHAVPRSLADDNWIKITAELQHVSKKIAEQPKFTWEFLRGKDEDTMKLYLAETEKGKNFNYIRWLPTEQKDKISTATILKVSCEVDNLNIEEYFPVPSKLSSGVDFFNCSNKIVYSHNGILKQYYADTLSLIYNSSYDNISFNSLNENDLEIKEKEDTKSFSMKPVNIYADINPIQCIQVKSGEAILWSQPIYVYQDRWPSEVLNEWDNHLTINENNGTILSAMMAAGSKDKNNTFTGVVMGKIKLDENKPENGLFGFKNGEETFGFKSDGTGFIGSSSGARIEFDGTNGFIQNENFTPIIDKTTGKEIGATEGLKIDFANAKILSPSFQLSQETGATAITGTIAGWKFDNEQIYSTTVDSATVYLYSQDQDGSTEVQNSGLRKDWRIKVGDNFGVTSDGTLFSNVLGQINPDSSVSTQLNLLSSDHTKIENRLLYIETLSKNSENNKTEIVTQLTEEEDKNKNLTILGRIVNLENSLGTKPGNVSKNIYQRVSDLEDAVKDLEALLKDFKAEPIEYITGFTPQTESITVTEGGSSKTITVITGITPDKATKTVLVKNNTQ